MISRIHSVPVTVADQDKALDFYVNTLGWQKAMDNPMGDGLRWLTVVPPGAQTQLALLTDRWGVPAHRSTGISLVTPDIEATYQALSERGSASSSPWRCFPGARRQPGSPTSTATSSSSSRRSNGPRRSRPISAWDERAQQGGT